MLVRGNEPEGEVIVRRNAYALAAAAVTVGLIGSACNSSGSGTEATSATTATSSSTAATSTAASAAPVDAAQLPSLIPAPGAAVQTKGPDTLPDKGIHLYFQVNGSPADVMTAYKSALEGKGWALTAIVSSSGGGGGGATYTGTHGAAYGVFDGGGFNTTTYIDVCAWPSKPANPNCNRGDR
jgi:hypothetical protein